MIVGDNYGELDTETGIYTDFEAEARAYFAESQTKEDIVVATQSEVEQIRKDLEPPPKHSIKQDKKG